MIPQVVNHSKAALISRHVPYSKEARKHRKNHVITDFRSEFIKKSAVNLRALGADRNGILLLHISTWSLNYALFT